MLYSLLGSGVIINNFTVSKPGVFTIYVNNSDENVIGKSLTYLTSFSTIRLKNATSVNEPTFLLTDIDAVVGRMNYIYYPQFDRYYFIKEITSVRDGL